MEELRGILTSAVALTGEPSETERFLLRNNLWEEKTEIAMRRGIRTGEVAVKMALQDISAFAAMDTGDIAGDLTTLGAAKSGEISRVNRLVGFKAKEDFKEGWAWKIAEMQHKAKTLLDTGSTHTWKNQHKSQNWG